METPTSVLEAVEEAIRSDERFSGAFEPLAEGLHREGDFWFVPVRREGFGSTESRFLLYARLAKLESDLQAERGLKVALLPIVEPVAA